MKKLMMAVVGLICAVGLAVAGNIDSPGLPSAGSGMYTLQGLYDYLISGTALSVAGSFQEPSAGPASTGKTTKQIGDDVKTLFDQCDAAAADVASGKKFFSAVSGSWGVQTGTASGGGGGLLKTGQTTSYHTGDDGYYQKGTAFDYTDNGDGTTTDNVTSLMWAKDGAGAGCMNSSLVAWTTAIDWAEGLTFAGYSDWRLPNVREIDSIIKRSGGEPFINTTYFLGTKDAYWSTTTYPNNTSDAFIAYFNYGYAVNYAKASGGGRVRAVRGGN